MADLLIELGCEEIPAGSVLAMAEHLGATVSGILSEAGLCDTPAQVFATPRRLAALWSDVGEQQGDQTVERRGPAVAAAWVDGEPSKALAGFLRSAGASVDDISTVATPKGDWIVVKQVKPGRALADVVADALPALLKTMPMPKRMRWSDQSHEFLRPVVWLVAMHGEKVLPLSLLGLQAGNTTLGHRFHAPEPLTINTASDYPTVLHKGYVVGAFQERKALIKNQVSTLASELGGHAVADDALLDEVTALVEWPVAIAGRFEEAFLEIPKEALIQTMQENQRYFALLDPQEQLMPAFITVANVESSNPDSVIEGNERVIRPRFADTMFFWNQDKQLTLADHRAQLGSLLFQDKLGSVADKVDRVQALSAWLATKVGASVEECSTAAGLCKCDLNTEIVKELAKMQGIAGRYYAARDGHGQDISVAMEEHYFPKQAGGSLPSNAVAQVVALADKTDTLVGIYGLGLIPTGAKDPFGLRRAALGIVRILIEKKIDLNLDELIRESVASFADRLPADLDTQPIVAYVLERLRGYAQEQGYETDVIDAVLAKALVNPLDIDARLQAMRAFRESPAASSLSAASKRVSNMLKQVESELPAKVDEALLQEPPEQALYAALNALEPSIQSQFEQRNYMQAMTSTAELREPVDAFFDGVMVMSDDLAVRANRLALLDRLNVLCSHTAELSQLQLP